MSAERELLESSQGREEETVSQKPDIRLELKVKNSRLWHAVHDRYGSVAGLCRAIPTLRTKQNGVGRLLRFKESPWTENGELRSVALALVVALAIPAEELFPEYLYREKWESERVLEVHSFTALPRVVREEIRLLPAPENVVEAAEKQELRERITRVLHTLTYREREILKLRFGLDGEREHTPEEVSRAFEISKERVRQIEAKTLQKLRRPVLSRQLEVFVT